MRMHPLPTGHGWFQTHVLEAVLIAIGLTVVVLAVTISLVWRIQMAPAPERAYERPKAAPVSLIYGPSFNPGTGTVYDGKGYGMLAQPVRPLSLVYGPDFNPGTGTVYDGKSR